MDDDAVLDHRPLLGRLPFGLVASVVGAACGLVAAEVLYFLITARA